MNIFEHGGNVVSFAQEVGCEVSQVIDLSSNINFIKPNIDTNFNLLDVSSYPNYVNLKNTLSELYNINSNEFEIFNGASSAIFSLFKYLKPTHCTIYSPAYLEYKRSAEMFKAECDLIDIFSDDIIKVKKESLVVFVNPSTPDGKYRDIEKYFNYWMEQNCTVLVDESFIEFSTHSSIVNRINDYDKLYVLKSMTKFYGAAGIRIGLLISNSKNIEKISKLEPAWKVSEFDQTYIQEAVNDNEFVGRSNYSNSKAKQYLIDILSKSNLVKKIYESDANFVLVKLNSLSASDFQLLLKPFKIMVRNCSNFDYLDDSHVRIAVKSIDELQALEKALNNA